MIVADVNLVLYLYFPCPQTSLAKRWAELDPEWALPPLWRFEFTSAVCQMILAGQLAPQVAKGVIVDATKWLSPLERSVDQTVVLDTALKRRISAYDANYVALAQELGTFCVTNDRQMLERARGLTRALSQFPDAVP